MRFQTSTNVPTTATTTDSPIAAAFRAVDDSETTFVKVAHLARSTESGKSLIVIPGSTRDFRINLLQVIVSWTRVVIPGEINIKGPDTPPIIFFETPGSGNIIIPCFGEDYYLGMYGLRATNNGQGGEYAVTAYYRLKDL